MQFFSKLSISGVGFFETFWAMVLGTSDYFLKYLIGCAFFSNIIALLDIPHKLWKMISKKDDWFFDLGYNYAFSLSIFVIALLYSTTAPLSSVCGFFFFLIKVRT
jgi:hypothetical protein